MALDREGIRNKFAKVLVKEVKVPEWNASVFVRQIRSGERDLFEGKNLDLKGLQRYEDLRARFLVLTLSDEQGNRLFQDDEVAGLSQLSGAVADLIWSEAWSFNRMGKEDLEALEKNSEGGPVGG